MSDRSDLEANNLKLGTITNKVVNMPNYLDTSDATALAGDIMVNKTAYVNGIKIEGTIPNNGTLNYSPMITVQNIPSGFTTGGTIEAVTSSIDVNISAENIKNGVNILGVTGTYEGSGEDVKLYDSITNMNLDHNVEDGQLAIVYYNQSANITANTEFQIGTFPETVTLLTAVTDYIQIGFTPVESGKMFDCFGNLNSTRYSIDCHTENDNIRIEYTSSDGINYTRTRFNKNNQEISGTEMDFGVVVKFGNRWGEATWYDAIGYFTQTGNVAFDGLYQYGDNSYSLAKTQFTVDKDVVYQGTFYGKNGVEIGSVQNVTNLSISQLQTRVNLYSDISNLSLNENITSLHMVFNGYNNLVTVPNFDTNNVTNMSCMFQGCTNLTSIPEFDTSNVSNMTQMFYGCTNLATAPNFDISNVSDMRLMFSGCTNLTTVPMYSMLSPMEPLFLMYMFNGCDNLSATSYANIANMLPVVIGGMLIDSLGLNAQNFTSEQCQILSDKGYLNVAQYIINSVNVSRYWDIYYE